MSWRSLGLRPCDITAIAASTVSMYYLGRWTSGAYGIANDASFYLTPCMRRCPSPPVADAGSTFSSDGESGTPPPDQAGLAFRATIALASIDPRGQGPGRAVRAADDADAVIPVPARHAAPSRGLIRTTRAGHRRRHGAPRVAGWTYGVPEMGLWPARLQSTGRRVHQSAATPTGAIALLRPLVRARPEPRPCRLPSAVSGYAGRCKSLISCVR